MNTKILLIHFVPPMIIHTLCEQMNDLFLQVLKHVLIVVVIVVVVVKDHYYCYLILLFGCRLRC